MDFQERAPAVERRVSEISAEETRVSVIGTVVDRAGDSLVLDDGSGKVTARFEGEVSQEPGKLVRLIGKVVPMEGGVELQGEVVQDFTGFDIELHKKVREKEKG